MPGSRTTGPGGWTGEGIVDVTLLKGINLPAQVTFDNAKLNDCYELAAGKLVTKYDPSWFVTPDIQHIFEETNDLATDIQDFVNTFTGGKEDIIKVDALLKDLEQAIADVIDNTELEQAVKEQMLEGLIDSQCALQQISNSLSTTTNSGGRLAVSSCTSCTSIPDCLKKATESALKFTSAIWEGLKNAISCNGTYANQQGLVPRCWWKNEKLSSVCELNDCAPVAFYAGIIDGAWETVTGIGSILEVISCNNLCVPPITGLPCSDVKEYTSPKCVAIRSVTDNLYSLAAENVKKTGASALNGSLFKEFVSYFTDGNDCGTDGVEPDACRNYKAGKAMLVVVDIIEGVGAAKALIKSGRSVMEAAMRRAINYARQLKAGTTFKFALSASRKELNVFVGGKQIGNQTDKGLLLTNKTDNIGTSIAHAENVEVYNPITKQTEVGSLDVDANGKCKFGPKCFVAGTPVHTRQGIRPIERIKPGDEVLSRDEITGQQTYKRVVQTFVKTTTRLVKVFAGNDTLLTTPEHPFRIGNRWVGAGMLQKGDALQQVEVATAANVPYLPRANLEVDSIAALDTTATVYNFEVADFHTYFVGRQGVWVHNSCLSDYIEDFMNRLGRRFQKPSGLRFPNDKPSCKKCKGGYESILDSKGNNRKVYIDEDEFPYFEDFVARDLRGKPVVYESEFLKGYLKSDPSSSFDDFIEANQWLEREMSKRGIVMSYPGKNGTRSTFVLVRDAKSGS